MMRTRRVDKNQSDQRAIVKMPWNCKQCGVQRPATAHQNRQIYCSKSCMARAYKQRMRGKSNPNYRNAGIKKCGTCNKEFHSYARRQYCSQSCSGRSERNILQLQSMAREPKKRRARKAARVYVGKCDVCGKDYRKKHTNNKYCSVICRKTGTKQSFDKTLGPKRAQRLLNKGTTCEKCGGRFYAPPSSKRKFCSYPCFVESGGAIRAGLSAARMRKVYGAKKDANHSLIADAFRKAGAGVIDLSALGYGVPDLVVWCHNQWHLVEVKNKGTGYGRRGLNKLQKAWADGWRGGPVYIVYGLNDVEEMLNGNLDKLKSSIGNGTTLGAAM